MQWTINFQFNCASNICCQIISLNLKSKEKECQEDAHSSCQCAALETRSNQEVGFAWTFMLGLVTTKLAKFTLITSLWSFKNSTQTQAYVFLVKPARTRVDCSPWTLAVASFNHAFEVLTQSLRILFVMPCVSVHWFLIPLFSTKAVIIWIVQTPSTSFRIRPLSVIFSCLHGAWISLFPGKTRQFYEFISTFCVVGLGKLKTWDYSSALRKS